MSEAFTKGMFDLGGSFLSGMFGSSSSDRARSDMYTIMNRQHQREDNQFQRMVADKKKAGLHPLAGVAGSGSTSPTTMAGQGGEMNQQTKMMMLLNAKNTQAQTSKSMAESKALDESRQQTKLNNELIKKNMPFILKKNMYDAKTSAEVARQQGIKTLLDDYHSKKEMSKSGQTLDALKSTLDVVGKMSNVLNPLAIAKAGEAFRGPALKDKPAKLIRARGRR
jgi:hypothetical protein